MILSFMLPGPWCFLTRLARRVLDSDPASELPTGGSLAFRYPFCLPHTFEVQTTLNKL